MRQEEIYEILVQNAQVGAEYYLKFRNNPIMYTAIPLIPSNSKDHPASMFTYRVVDPVRHRGVYEEPIKDIELLERKE